MAYRGTRHLLAIATFVTLVACKGMQALYQLQQGLAAEFQSAEVSVNVYNGRALTVTFWNSPFGDLRGDSQTAFCRHAAEYVRDHYPGYEELQTIAVAFATRQAVGPVSMTHSETACSFNRSGLGEPVAASKAKT